jgi:carboxypeptidase family protein
MSRFSISSAAFALLFSILSFAQSDLSTITGVIKDPSGSSVPNAKVTVRNEATGVERSTTSADSGTFSITNLPSGLYTLSVEAPGFKKYQKTRNKLDPSVPLAVDATLDVGAVSDTVSVVAETQRIQSESATVGALVEEAQVKNMMLNGRNPVLLAALKPGVRSSASLANFNFNLTDGGFSMNGSRPNDNVFFYDGAVATRTRSNGTSIGAADVDATQEVQILTANYNAEYGRSGGGQIRVVTKSGGRDFHGQAYEYFRNSAMDANTWARNISPFSFQNSVPQPLKYNQFGFGINGPVYIPGKFNTGRNKLFFLVNEEWVRYRTTPTNTATVPSLAMRQGDFSELLRSNIFFNRSYVVADPATGTPFPNNIIPQSRLSANGIALMNAYPKPAAFVQGNLNYIVSNGEIDNTRKDSISLDYLPTDRDTIRLRVLNYSYYVANAFQGTFPMAANQLDRPNQTASLNHIHVFTPTLINEALVSASADHVDITLRGTAWQRTQYNVNYPYLYGAAAKDLPDKMPTVNINGFTQLDNGPYPSRSGGPIYSFSDNVTWIKGNHTLKAGFLFERAGQNDRDQVNVNGIPGGANNQNGRFDFQDTGFSGNTNPGIADLALGRFNSYAEIGPRDYTISRGNMFEFFVQDSWKVTPKLKLELGLRETILQPYYALWGNYDVFDARFYDPAKAVSIDPRTGTILPGTGDIYNGMVIPGDSFPSSGNGRFPSSGDTSLNALFRGLPKTYADWRKNNFVPRIGVAYQINEKTVVRAGFGGFKNRPAVSDSTFLGGNFPFQGYVAVSNGVVDNPLSASGGTPTQFIQTQDPVWKTPTSYQWNFTVQRELPWQSNIEVQYIGRVGLWMERTRNLNQLPAGTCPLGNCPNGVNVNYLVPYKGYNQIQIAENASRSEYNGLNVAWNRRFAKGLGFGVAYTYSKSFDNASTRRDIPFNNLDDHSFWGPSNFDTRHIAVINWIYELPYKHTTGASGLLLGGWQITGITQFQTGTPFTIGTNTDYAGIGTAAFQPWQVNGNATLSKGDQGFSNSASDSNFWFRTKNGDGSPIFTAPALGTFSNQTKNLYYGPGFQNWNLGLFKTFKIHEQHAFTFRVEAFNWLNHPNWGGANGSGQFGIPPSPQGQPNGNPTSSTFGKVTTKDSRRQLQLSLKYSF